MFGTHRQGVSCRLMYIIVLYQLPNFISSQCGNGTYFSHDLEGCLDCPDIPSIDCRDVHQSDIKSCLENCISITATSTPSHHEKKPTPTTKHPSKHLRQRIGGIILDHFIVLVCVVVLGTLAVAYIVWKCVHPERWPTYTVAAYYLRIGTENTAVQSENTTNGRDKRQSPGAIQLPIRTQRI
ncbi:Hypothetical predicted protein [Paramuricea clavata]|nr:Hypothetical predicted protein [Paramuricea clavata]